jgi:threonylcarbamoyladenosine tRNA methylthiotransferase MtaB
MSSLQKIAFHTLGCKLNFAETSAIGKSVEGAGFTRVEMEAQPDVVVINTCSVTDNADKECRYLIRRFKKQNPEARIVIIGCYAQLRPNEIASIDDVDLVLGANEKFNLPAHLQQLKVAERKGVVYGCDINDVEQFISSYSLGGRTRSFVKVQDGCDYTCSYCTIPLARGKSRSDTVTHTVNEVYKLAEQGIKEIVLTGVNLGDFGKSGTQKDDHIETFYDLLVALEKTPVERFRISSIEPNLVTDKIISLVAQSEKIMPHFHIPLQSGSNKILNLMRRRYLRNVYTERVEKIKQQLPHCCIGADVIVGFPDETDEDFSDTYNFINELDVSYMHVFTYSERSNTLAASLPNAVPIQKRNERNKMLRILSEKKRHCFYEQHINETRPVLFEIQNEGGFMYGYTDNYIKVKHTYTPQLIKQITPVILTRHDHEVMLCSLNPVNTVQPEFNSYISLSKI